MNMYGHNHYTVLQLCCYVSCGILNDLRMKHGETLKTKNSGTKKKQCTNIVKSYLVQY